METVVFDFYKYAQTKLCAEDQLYVWARQFKTANISRVKVNNLSQPEYERLIEYLEVGITCQFNPVRFEIYLPLHQALTNAQRRADHYAVEKKQYIDTIVKCDTTLIQGDDIPAQLAEIIRKITELQGQCTSKKMHAQLRANSNYQALKKERVWLELYQFSPENLVKKRDMAAEYLYHLESREQLLVSRMKALEVKCEEILKISSHYKTPSAVALMPLRPGPPGPGTSDLPNQTIQVEWQDLYFGDGSFLVKYRGIALNSCLLPESRRFLNAIKVHYKFRNAPLLQLLINGRTILRVINKEVILFYVKFLTDSCSRLEIDSDIRPRSISRFARYNKSYYQTHLPNLFQSRCLHYLCQLTAADSFIIPTPELVITTNGTTSIDDSFLFPIKSHQRYFIAWESTEESKATYLFQASANGLLSTLQLIYDYLVGPTVNKRETLIFSPVLQRQLGFVTRVKHTSFTDWKAEVHICCSVRTRVPHTTV
ncbi:hypothetical protein [Hymenobacter antarcticus]|uniref:hypothetical protein n=1 Tax=Hymenobacter antarcticus TaxID=486270 RepID=UPI0031EBBE25